MNRTWVRRSLIGIAGAGLALAAFGHMCGWLDPSAPSERTLVRALAGVDRIRVRLGGTCHRDIASERTLFGETDPGQIEAVIQAIRIQHSLSRLYCGCCGELSIELYRGDELAVTLGYHHGRLLRWREGWRGDGPMTAASAAWLNAWLSAHGVKSKYGEW